MKKEFAFIWASLSWVLAVKIIHVSPQITQHTYRYTYHTFSLNGYFSSIMGNLTGFGFILHFCFWFWHWATKTVCNLFHSVEVREKWWGLALVYITYNIGWSLISEICKNNNTLNYYLVWKETIVSYTTGNVWE